MAEIDWKREFDTLGSKGVRGALIANRWDEEKRSAAREWLERSDAAAWQANRAPSDKNAPATSSLDAFRRYKWVYYIAGAAFGLLGLSQIFKF
jgi:hypothetical protein